MRTNLLRYLHQTIEVRGTVTSIGTNKKNKKQKCISLINVKHNIFQEDLCDHTWIRVGKRMFAEDEEIQRGDVIKFHAKVKTYQKSNGVDYGFFYVSKVKIVNRDLKLVQDWSVKREEFCTV